MTERTIRHYHRHREPRRRANPWMAIGWIVLFLIAAWLVLSVAFCGAFFAISAG